MLARRLADACFLLRLQLLLATSHHIMALLVVYLGNLFLLSTQASLNYLRAVILQLLHHCRGVWGQWPRQKLRRVCTSHQQALQAFLPRIYLHELGYQLKLWLLLGVVLLLLLKSAWWLIYLCLWLSVRRTYLLTWTRIGVWDKMMARLIFHHQRIWWRWKSLNSFRFNNPWESGAIATTDWTIDVLSNWVVEANIGPKNIGNLRGLKNLAWALSLCGFLFSSILGLRDFQRWFLDHQAESKKLIRILLTN